MRIVALIVALAAAACAGPAVKESFYTLAGPSAPPPAAGASALTIHVGPTLVPEAVDRMPMVLRRSPHEVQIAEHHRWAEPLKVAIARVVAEHLMHRLNTTRVTSSRLASGTSADYRVSLEVQRFESSLTQGATIDVLWTVTPARGGAPRTGRSTVSEPAASADPAGVAAAHSRALARVAADIASAIAQSRSP